MVIVVANGTHLGGDTAELRALVTDAIYQRVQVINHDCLSPDLIEIGITSFGTRVSIDPYVASRKVICICACTQHLMAGFGGGRKALCRAWRRLQPFGKTMHIRCMPQNRAPIPPSATASLCQCARCRIWRVARSRSISFKRTPCAYRRPAQLCRRS